MFHAALLIIKNYEDLNHRERERERRNFCTIKKLFVSEVAPSDWLVLKKKC